jgi:hypothetical protein
MPATMTKYQTLYVLTEDELRAISRLSDAARLLNAALPATHTTTPIGRLESLTDGVASVTIFATPMRECDECGAAPIPTIRCNDCDTHRCHRCYYAHKH